MAKTTTLIDDLSGEPGAEERRFSIGGVDYSVDLTPDNYRAFLLTIEPWRSVASVARKQRRLPYPPLTKEARQKIRAWANETGKTLAPRGRFPASIVRAYYEEQADEWDKLQRDVGLTTR